MSYFASKKDVGDMNVLLIPTWYETLEQKTKW